MSRSLPVRPNLVQLKPQAKDLRVAAREGAPDAFASFRRLRRYAGHDDAMLSRTKVTLSEARFALALDCGFESWARLRAHVEAASCQGGNVRRLPGGAIVVEGFELERCGGGTRRQCSTIATLALISECSGDDTDYDYLMGASAAAFRARAET